MSEGGSLEGFYVCVCQTPIKYVTTSHFTKFLGICLDLILGLKGVFTLAGFVIDPSSQYILVAVIRKWGRT